MLGLKERPGIGDGTAVSPGVPGPAVVGREEGVCSGQALRRTEPGRGLARDAWVPTEPTAALLLPSANVIYGTGCCFAGPFPESREGCSLL